MPMKSITTLFLILLFTKFGIAQSTHIPRDTSFNVKATFEKERKKYPFIQMVNAQVPKGVVAEYEVVYTSYGNRSMHLDLYYPPKKKKKLPAVVFIHGGGWRSGDKTMEAPLAQKLASKGYVTACVEYRLSLEALYPAAVLDIKAAIRWLRANAGKYAIDTSKIAVLGCSAGGQLAALLGSIHSLEVLKDTGDYLEYSSQVQATVDIDGVLAFIHPESSEGKDTDAKKSAATAWFGQHFTENALPWQEASALTHVGKQTTPILFINSSHPRFHAGRDDMTAQLDSLGIYYEVHTLPDTPHPFWLFHPWFDTTFDWVRAFLDKVLN
jgi:acetyl esterase/lipase